MMQDAIKKFPEQFAYQPVIQNKNKLKKFTSVIVLGMGGSHLAADLIRTYNPSLPLIIHSDYGLPAVEKAVLKQSLIIASSYSGNTEEVIEGLEMAKKQKLNVAVLAVGGKLIEKAKKYGLPYVQMPSTGIQPRSALGFSLIGMLALMGEKKALAECRVVSKINSAKMQKAGQALAEKLKNKVPVIYTSVRNAAVSYNWKIKLNETGKIPAFSNIFPELNHNEMTGFDVKNSSQHLSEKFYFIFILDKADHVKNQKRMKITAKLYKDRGFACENIEMKGKNTWEKIFSSLLLADWTAVSIANMYGLESEQVPMVEEFKKLIEK